MRIDYFFPVPYLVHDVDAVVREAIRTKVHAYLESDAGRDSVVPAPEESVATSYFRPEASILTDAGLDELEALVLDMAGNYLEKTLQVGRRALEIERAWINVFEPGAQEAQHTHDGSLLSCSYYVEAPPGCGYIAFPDPIAARRSYREFTHTTGSSLLTRREIAFEPVPGRLVMFESWIPHYVQCNKSDRPRISIAINLREGADRTVSLPNAENAGVALGDATTTSIAGPASEQSATEGPAPAAPATAAAAAAASAHGSAAADRHRTPPPGQPFLFNDVFDVHTHLKMDQGIAGTIPAVILDDFLTDPERAREVVGAAPAGNWKLEEGGRNFVDYYDCRLRFPVRYPNKMIAVAQKAIMTAYSLETRPQDASVDVNWFMQIAPKRADYAVPHCDMTEGVRRSFTCIVYLNRPSECSGGTAFFRFRKSGSLVIDEAYARAVTDNRDIAETGRDYWPGNPEASWELVGTADMVPGRMIIFPSEYFHAAWHPDDAFYDFPRLTLAFWMVC